MDILLSTLYDIVEASNVSDLKIMAKEIINKFFPELDAPEFKIVHNTIPKWLGLCRTTLKDGVLSTVISIQKSILNDEETLHRVLCHELIHCFLHHHMENFEREIRLKKLGLSKSSSHGKEFHEIANKMNATFGKDYVTEKSNLSYVVEDTKDYFIIIEPYKENLYGVTKTVRPSKKQELEIANRIQNKNAHVFQTKDATFKDVSDIKKYGGFSVYKDQSMQEKLAEMYNSENIDHLFKVS